MLDCLMALVKEHGEPLQWVQWLTEGGVSQDCMDGGVANKCLSWSLFYEHSLPPLARGG